jgi:hypothetical protein
MFPKDIIEISFNMLHTCFFAQEQINKFGEIKTDKEFEYLFFTIIFIVSKVIIL